MCPKNVVKFKTGLVPLCVELWLLEVYTSDDHATDNRYDHDAALRPHETPPEKSCWCGDSPFGDRRSVTYAILGTAYFYCTRLLRLT